MPPAVRGGIWTKATLYSFSGGSDGANPVAGLIFDTGGNLYGTTSQGGSSDAGTVFKLTPPTAPGGAWTKTTLYSFAGGNDGADPIAGLIFDTGSLYGTTEYGGSGYGTVFNLTPPTAPEGTWTKTTLYSFAGGQRR